MSLRPDGTYRCDRCDADVGNASLEQSMRVSDLLVDVEGGTSVVVYDFCRISTSEAPDGCAALVLAPANLAAYTAAREGAS